MRALANNIVRAVKTHRLALPWRIVKKLVSKVVYWKQIDIYAKRFGKPGATIAGDPSPATLHRIRDRASAQLSRLQATFPGKDFSTRLGKGGWQCYVALMADRIVGFAWVVTDEYDIEEVDYRYPLNAHEFFIYDCFVSADYRGRGIYPAMINRIMRDNAAEATDSASSAVAYIGVDAMNAPSIRGIHKAGFTEINSIRHLRTAVFRHWWCRHPVPVIPRQEVPG